MKRRILLVLGVVSGLVYVAADLIAALVHPGYHSFSARVVSELMASGAPTERLVDPLFLLYGVLMMGFAVGVWMSRHERRTHLTAALLFANGAIGLLGPTLFEMDVRVPGASGPSRMMDCVNASMWRIVSGRYAKR